eukprot:6030856-Amphidinium_carterae.1
MAATPAPQEIVPTNLAIFRDVERPPLQVVPVSAPLTPAIKVVARHLTVALRDRHQELLYVLG